MLKKFITIIFSSFISLVSYSQASGTKIISGKILENNNPVKNLEITFYDIPNNKKLVSTYTSLDGSFARPISDEIYQVRIEISGNRKVVYPLNSIIDIRYSGAHLDIIIGDDKKKDEVEAILRKLEEIQKSSLNLSDFEIKLVDFEKKLFEGQQTIVKRVELQYLLEKEKIKLRNSERRLKVLPPITGSIDLYISRARDLKDEFKRRKNGLFYDNGKNINHINWRIISYSEAYEVLESNRQNYIIAVTEYWPEHQQIVSEFELLLKSILDHLHKTRILNYELVLGHIEKFNNREKGRRKKNEIQYDIDEFVGYLDQQIEIIERDKAKIIQALKSAN